MSGKRWVDEGIVLLWLVALTVGALLDRWF